MRYKYSKFTGEIADEMDLEDLVSQLSDLLLFSGFGDRPGFDDGENSMEALHDAIMEALLNGGLLSQETLERLLGEDGNDRQKGELEKLIAQLIERMQREGYVTASPDLEQERRQRQRRASSGGGVGPAEPSFFGAPARGFAPIPRRLRYRPRMRSSPTSRIVSSDAPGCE